VGSGTVAPRGTVQVKEGEGGADAGAGITTEESRRKPRGIGVKRFKMDLL